MRRKQHSLCMKSSLLMHKHIIVRQLIYSYETFALFIRGLFKLQLAKQRLPKQAKSSTAKVRQICQEYPDEFPATPAGDLRCKLCDVLIKCNKKCFVESHRKSKQHQEKLETKNKSQSNQPFLQLNHVNFMVQVVSSFLAADISLHKLNQRPFFKVSVCCNGKSIAFGYYNPGMWC